MENQFFCKVSEYCVRLSAFVSWRCTSCKMHGAAITFIVHKPCRIAFELSVGFGKIIKARIHLLNSISVWRVHFQKETFSGKIRWQFAGC
jgi:hypothetical protein